MWRGCRNPVLEGRDPAGFSVLTCKWKPRWENFPPGSSENLGVLQPSRPGFWQPCDTESQLSTDFQQKERTDDIFKHLRLRPSYQNHTEHQSHCPGCNQHVIVVSTVRFPVKYLIVQTSLPQQHLQLEPLQRLPCPVAASRAVSAVTHAWLVTCRPNPGWHADIIWDESELCSAFRMYDHGTPLQPFCLTTQFFIIAQKHL